MATGPMGIGDGPEFLEDPPKLDTCPLIVLFNQGARTSVPLGLQSQGNPPQFERLSEDQVARVAQIGEAVKDSLRKGHDSDTRTMFYQSDSWLAHECARILMHPLLGFAGEVMGLDGVSRFTQNPNPKPLKDWRWETAMLKPVLDLAYDLYVVSFVGDFTHPRSVLQAYRELVPEFPEAKVPDDSLVLAPGDALIVPSEADQPCVHIDKTLQW